MAPEVPSGDRRALRALEEGRRFESYAEHHTREMHPCFLCERVIYRRIPIKKIGNRWICLDCLRALKEALETLDRWEHLSHLEGSAVHVSPPPDSP